MPKLLYISVSPQGENSKSRSVAKEFLKAFQDSHPDYQVVERDLSANPVPHADAETLFAGYTPEDKRPPSMQKKHQFRLSVIDELINADEILVSAPMWNWNVPSVLKAYIDHIVMPGVLDPSANAKLAGKRVTVIIATGGAYGEGSWHPEWDFESGYLSTLFTNLGSKDVKVIRTEYTLAGVVPGMEGLVDKKEESFKDAKAAAIARAVGH